MSKTEFRAYAARRGVYEAALLAAALGVSLATVQNFLRG